MTLHVKTAADTFRGPSNSRFFNRQGWSRNARQVQAARIKAERERKAAAKTASVAEQLGVLRSEGKVRDLTVTVPETPAAVAVVETVVPGWGVAPPSAAETLARYMGMTVAVMRGIARDRGLKGYSRLKKAELAAKLVG